MTTIVWDGEILASDKQCSWDNLKTTVTKISEVDGFLFGCAGNYAHAQTLIEWFMSGADPKTFPDCQKGDDHVDMLVITPDRDIHIYGQSPYPMDFTETQKVAIGSGSEFALGAMAMGADAVQAVEVASAHDINTGQGIDILNLPEKSLVKRIAKKLKGGSK